MEFKPLSNSTTEQVWEAFNDAFSDYEVPIQMPLEKFIKVGNRRGTDYAISLGGYDKKRLAGFVANAGGDWQGEKTIYDCFTGVIKDYQRKGVATQMLEESFSNSKKLGFESYLLEVIQTNTKAYELYLSKGFEVVRNFDIYRCEVSELNLPNKCNEQIEIKIVEETNWNQLKKFWDIYPSWQNSIDAIKRTREDFEIFAAYDKELCVGYLVIETTSGDVPQIAVHKDHRRKGIASSLVKKAAENRKEGYRLSFLNIESEYTPYCDFLKKLGSKIVVKQYEMIKEL